MGLTTQILQYVAFSSPLFSATADQLTTGSFLTGRWINGNTQLVITLLNTFNVSIVDTSIGHLTVNVSGITDATGKSAPINVVNVPVVGTWGQSSTPKFLSNGRGFEASNSGGQVGIGAGDKLYLRFNQPIGSALVPIATKSDIDGVFNFSVAIGKNYTGVWQMLYRGLGLYDYQVRLGSAAGLLWCYRRERL